jgi:hypothetical protein
VQRLAVAAVLVGLDRHALLLAEHAPPEIERRRDLLGSPRLSDDVAQSA